MGISLSRVLRPQLRHHEMFNLAMCHSTFIDPRHLEHLTYPLWTSIATSVILRARNDVAVPTDFTVAPQCPIWVSYKDNARHDAQTQEELPVFNLSIGSEPDGSAVSVFVDIAVIRPRLCPRPLEQLPKNIPKELRGKSLHDVLTNPTLRPHLRQRYLYVDEILAPILMELKSGPPRHPANLDAFLKGLRSKMRDAESQAVEQGFCLLSSWRSASQEEVFLLAVCEEFWRVRRFTRRRAQLERPFPFNSTTLERLKATFEDPDPDHVVTALEESFAAHSNSSPADALQHKLELQKAEAAARSQRLKDRKERLPTADVKAALRQPPNYEDRSLPLFTDEEISAGSPEPFFETRSPSSFFKEGSNDDQWSKYLRLGRDLSDQYLDFLSTHLQRCDEAERAFRKTVFFQ